MAHSTPTGKPPAGKLKQLRYLLEAGLLRFALWLIPKLNRWTLLTLSRSLGTIGYWVDYRGRHNAQMNLLLCYPVQSRAWRQQVAKKSTLSMARTMFDLVWFAANVHRGNYQNYIEIDWQSPRAKEAALEPNTIFLTPHYGNFEIGNLVMAFLGNQSLVLAQDFKNPHLTPLFSSLRERAGNTMVSRDGAMLKLLRHLKRKGQIGFLADLNIPPGQAAVPLRVFGRWISAPALPAILAERAQSQLIGGLCYPLKDGRYRVEIFDPLERRQEESTRALTQRIWEQFEAPISQKPEYWLWAYKHWRYLPAGGQKAPSSAPRQNRATPSATLYPEYANRSKAFDKLLREHGVEDDKER